MDEPQEPDQLRIYIEYNEFLGAHQLVDMLGTLDRIYSYLYSSASGAPFPLPPEARLRIQETRTGNSIELLLVEGLGQVWNGLSPTIEVGIPLGVLTSMSRLIIGMARRLRGVRSVGEADDTPPPPEPAHAPDRRGRHPEPRRRSSAQGRVNIELSPEVKKIVLQDISNIIIEFDLAGNISKMTLNDEPIVDKTPAASRQ
jgi:hypothetical protein